MARKRMIDPNIWQSEDFSKLSMLAKLVFIGLFSLADDEGRGICNPMYLKSSIFPYEESLRSADIEKTLSEISSNMSVIFYSCDGKNFYSLYNWDRWQTINRPSESKIPEYDENTMIRLFSEDSVNAHGGFTPNIKRKEINRREKENKKEKSFIPPTLEEIKNYVNEKGLSVSAVSFFDYFTAGNWIDSKGNRVKNWKQKILTWNTYSTAPPKKETKGELKNPDGLDEIYEN